MKLKTHLIVSIAAALCMCAGNVRADVLQIVTISVTTFTQSSTNDNGTNTTFAPPKSKSHNTAEILKALAQDEYAAGNYLNTNFPAGAKLAAGNDSFLVVNGTNILVDVSDILKFQDIGDNVEIVSGKQSDLTGLANPTVKRLHLGQITFDDTGINGGTNLKFFIAGLVSDSETDTVPDVNGVYTVTKTGKITNGIGQGTDSDGTPFVLTGTVTVRGRTGPAPVLAFLELSVRWGPWALPTALLSGTQLPLKLREQIVEE
jgi:hypothetical protein